MFNEYDPNDQNGNYSYNQGGNPPPYHKDRDGSTAQILGILSLVLLFVFGTVVAIILGALAIHYANRSRNTMRYETIEAKTGRVCGIISLILGVIGTLIFIAFLIFSFALAFSGLI